MIRAVALILLAGAAQAEEMRPQEAERLAAFDTTFGEAVRGALAEGRRGDVDLLQEALSGPALAPVQSQLAGDWRCRTLKLGGLAPLTAYAPFDCRFTPEGAVFRFEKLSGSQRTSGTVFADDAGRLIYLGVGYVADAEPVAYADLPDGLAGDGIIQPQVGLVEQVSPTKARILFPAPVVESQFDILYLTR